MCENVMTFFIAFFSQEKLKITIFYIGILTRKINLRYFSVKKNVNRLLNWNFSIEQLLYLQEYTGQIIALFISLQWKFQNHCNESNDTKNLFLKITPPLGFNCIFQKFPILSWKNFKKLNSLFKKLKFWNLAQNWHKIWKMTPPKHFIAFFWCNFSKNFQFQAKYF